MKLVVVSAGLSALSSTRQLADRLAAATVEARAGVVEVEVVDLRPLAHDLTDLLLSGAASPALVEAVDVVRRADAMIAATPVYSASYSGLFKLFFDVLEPGLLEGLPVLVAATAGSARHALVLDHALRPLFSHLRAVVAPTGVLAAAEDAGDPELERRIVRAGAELAAMVPARRDLHVVRDDPERGSAAG